VERCVTVDPKTISSVPSTEQPNNPDNLPSGTTQASRPITRPHVNIWLLRLRALLFVTMCATLGVLLIILPWTPKWTDNPLLLSIPELRPIVSNGFVRGLCSGLGVLDLWLGFWEAIYYHENPVASE
jgi:hypothetical protein